MKLNKIINVYCQKYDAETKNDEKKKIIFKLACEIGEIRKNDNDYNNSVFKLCRKCFVQRKISNYSHKEKIMEFIYMYCLRKPGYYIKKLLKKQINMPKEFYLKPAYYWDYLQGNNWCGYWGEDIIDHIDVYNEIYEKLYDAKSKLIFNNIMMARLSNDWNYYKISCESREKEYFDSEIIDILSEMVIVDGGGYTGDTYRHFEETCGKEYVKHWYLYEPDWINMQMAKKNLSENKNVIFRQAGLSDVNSRINFISTGTVGSKSGKEGEEFVNVVSLDSDINEKITLLKLDVEGMELKALKGAEKHIVEDKPTLVICLYHKKGDIPEIINYVRKLNSNYKLYIRHYSAFHWDTVLYAKI